MCFGDAFKMGVERGYRMQSMNTNIENPRDWCNPLHFRYDFEMCIHCHLQFSGNQYLLDFEVVSLQFTEIKIKWSEENNGRFFLW